MCRENQDSKLETKTTLGLSKQASIEKRVFRGNPLLHYFAFDFSLCAFGALF